MTGLFATGFLLKNAILNFLDKKIALIQSDESGVTAVEYALIIGLIAIVIIGAVTLLGSSISDLFSHARCSIVSGVWTAGTGTAAGTCSK
jgi:pilus assembly protein Flp/PilA